MCVQVLCCSNVNYNVLAGSGTLSPTWASTAVLGGGHEGPHHCNWPIKVNRQIQHFPKWSQAMPTPHCAALGLKIYKCPALHECSCIVCALTTLLGRLSDELSSLQSCGSFAIKMHTGNLLLDSQYPFHSQQSLLQWLTRKTDWSNESCWRDGREVENTLLSQLRWRQGNT